MFCFNFQVDTFFVQHFQVETIYYNYTYLSRILIWNFCCKNSNNAKSSITTYNKEKSFLTTTYFIHSPCFFLLLDTKIMWLARCVKTRKASSRNMYKRHKQYKQNKSINTSDHADLKNVRFYCILFLSSNVRSKYCIDLEYM